MSDSDGGSHDQGSRSGLIAILAICLIGAAQPPANKANPAGQPATKTHKSNISDKTILNAETGYDKSGAKSEIRQDNREAPKVGGWRWLLALMDRHNGALNAIFSGFVALFTLMLFLVGRDQHGTLKKSVAAAIKSADAAIAAQRPWIRIEVEPKSALTTNDLGITGMFDVRIWNEGNSPSTNVQCWVVMFCCGSLQPFRYSLEAIPQHVDGFGFSIFPGRCHETEITGGAPPDQMAAALSEAKIADRIDIMILVSASYDFIGGRGLTRRMYRLESGGLMESFDVRQRIINYSLIPVEADDLAS